MKRQSKILLGAVVGVIALVIIAIQIYLTSAQKVNLTDQQAQQMISKDLPPEPGDPS